MDLAYKYWYILQISKIYTLPSSFLLMIFFFINDFLLTISWIIFKKWEYLLSYLLYWDVQE